MTAVLANSPVSFTDATGSQMSIPLSDIYFDSSGAIKADRWPPYPTGSSTFKNQVDAWLQYLVKKGDLVKDTAAPVPAAMLVEAKQAGATGNSVRLVVSNVREVTGNEVFDVTVMETNTYTGLTPATIKNVIGTSAGGGTQPGLVFVSSAGAPAMPAAVTDQALADSPTATAILKAAATTAFELTPKAAGTDGHLTKVTIKDVDATAGTFTLVAVWTKTATGIQPSAMLTDFDYELTISVPTGATALAVPAPGAVVLSGGEDAQGPQRASAVLAANQ